MNLLAFPFYILPYFNIAIAIAGLLLLGITLVLGYDLLCRQGSLYTYIQPWVWPAVIATTVGSVVISLLYSEYFGFIPCSLCWLQRIAIYPQALLSIIAWRLKDVTYYPIYGLALSAAGFVVAVYHYLYQMLPRASEGGLLPCLADGTTADCADRVIDLFGFVTFPFLSAVLFLFLIATYEYIRRYDDKELVL